MKDYMVRATAANGQVRAFAAYTREMVDTARQSHNTSPVATAALGRLLTASCIMGSMMKNDTDLLTINVRGDGPLKGITVTADNKGNAKGYVMEPDVILPANAKGKLDVGGAVGKGFLNVIKDIGLKDPYAGQVELVSGEIAEDLTYYFAASEQTPSSVALGVLMNKDNTVAQAGGFIIQLMPGCDEDIIDKLEERLAQIDSVTGLLSNGSTPENILNILLGDMELDILDRMPVRFYCNCSKDRVEKALISIGRKEIAAMIEEGKTIELKCQFCNKAYEFEVGELERILMEII
jgi:molecular chaperone Hsp33